MKPVHIFVGGEELLGWTEMTLKRAKKDMTGSLSISMFFSYMPQAPVAISATKNKEITVYIGGALAFTGKIDKRQGSGVKQGQDGSDDNFSGFEKSVSIGADEYTVKLTARGKTKYLIEASHQHPTTNALKISNKEAFEKLLQPWGIDLDWKAAEIKLDKLRLRDGAKVVHEIQRLAEENGHFVYETRDGKLRITDDTGREEGEPLILGQNIMTFSAEQSEESAKKKVKVKGQRTEKGIRGSKAVIGIEKEVEDRWVEGDIPFILQHYGDGSPEALERRANFETNKRSSEAKTLTVEVFHVQGASGDPWDVGMLHYCEVPPEGIYDVFECTELTYSVSDDKLKTTLTLSPPPANTAPSGEAAGSAAGQAGLSGLASLINASSGLAQLVAQGKARRQQAGITFKPGQYPAPWSGPDVHILAPAPAAVIAAAGAALFAGLSQSDQPPVAKLPESFQGEGSGQ